METQQNHQQQGNEDGGNKSSNFLCRQSSTRWRPTTEQIRILRDLYHNNGLRSPNAEQIHRIVAKLRQYGKIEGKNVFYWFQNKKTRECRKKRFASTAPSTSDVPMHHRSPAAGVWKYHFASNLNAAGFPSSSSVHGNRSDTVQGGGYHPEIETLPLFPMHDEHTFKKETNVYNGLHFGPRAEDNNMGSSGASLELTLNSYSTRSLNSP